jgi:2-desacetyl-2-hydroxyethyl bacteriochlorophyllide A dehydrogenase
MLAALFREHGGLDRLKCEEIATPEPHPGEALIRVKACGVNRVDLLSRLGETPGAIALPHVSGTETAGEIVELGGETAEWRIGDRVLVNPTISCGRCSFCRSGEDNMCLTGRIYGVQTWGGYAEYAIAPVEHLLKLPDELSFDTAAAIAVTGSTAWHMLMRRANLRPGETVLVVAAGSGIGVIGVQIAKLCGAVVIASAGSEAKLQRARELGADHTINHADPNWSKTVRRLTEGRGVDVVFEHVGAATWEGSLNALTRGGRLVTCGGHSGFTVKINLWHLFVKQHTLIGSFAGSRKDLEDVIAMARRGLIKPVIHAKLPLEEAAEAQRQLDGRDVFGKLLLAP